MTPVAIGKKSQLAPIHQSVQFVQNLLKVRGIGQLIVVRFIVGVIELGQGRRLGRIGLQGAGDIHPVQRVEMVKMHDMIVNVLGPDHHITDIFRIF